MRNTVCLPALFVGFFLAANGLFADTKIWLLHESFCMDKYESWYTSRGVGNASAPLVQFAVKPGGSIRAFLETDMAAMKDLRDQPKGMKKCTDLIWDDALIKDINRGKTDVFLVFKTKTGWEYAPVSTAALMTRTGSVWFYSDRDFNFRVDTAASFQADNMATPESDFLVMKKDHIIRECLHVHVLRREAKKTCEAFSNFEFMPAFGIVQENSGLTEAEAADNQLNIYKINGRPFLEVLKERCYGKSGEPASVAAATRPVESSWGSQPTQSTTDWGTRPTTYSQPDELRDRELAAGGGIRSEPWAAPKPDTHSTPSSVPDNCSLAGRDGFHVVRKGDNLYRLAREYGLTVGDLKAWNGLKADDIAACSYLKISGNAGPIPEKSAIAAATRPVESSTGKPCDCDKKNGQKQPSVGVKPTVYSTPTTVKSQPVVQVSGDEFHVIQPGENLTLIGEAYKMTATDLAKLNGIDRNSILFPGQKLRITPNNRLQNTAAEVKPASYSFTEKSASPCYHAVLEGDNLSKIARANGYTVERLMSMNGITDRYLILQVGQPIFVGDCGCEAQKSASAELPAGGGFQPSAEPKKLVVQNDWTASQPAAKPAVYDYQGENWSSKSEVKPASLRYIHTVADGETQVYIARKYNMDIDRFRRINSLEMGEVMVPGQKIMVE